MLTTNILAQEAEFTSIQLPDSINTINDIHKSASGDIYIATNRGFYKYFPSIDQFEIIFKSKDLEQLKINVIHEYTDNSFFLGTYRSSVVYLDNKKEIKEFSFKYLLEKEQLITDLNIIDKVLYLTTSEGNIVIFDKNTEKFSLHSSPVKSEINAIWKDKSETLWISSMEGVFYYQQNEWLRLKGFFQAYGLKVKSGEYWVIGRDDEFNAKIKYLYNYETEILKKTKQKWAELVFHNLPNSFLRFNDIDFDSQGMIWLASNIGVLKYDPFTGYSIWYSNEKYEKFPFTESSYILVINDKTILVSHHNKFCKISYPENY